MRKLVFDQFEFDASSSEESLEIHIAQKCFEGHLQFRDLLEFAAATGVELPLSVSLHAVPYNDRAGFSSVRTYLQQLANITVPDPCNWQMYVLRGGYGAEWDGFLESEDMYIRYNWLTTA